jgi:hypothetical protein
MYTYIYIIYLFVYLFIYSFIYLFIYTCTPHWENGMQLCCIAAEVCHLQALCMS